MIKYGEQSWDEENNSSKKDDGGKEIWLRLKEGNNQLRILNEKPLVYSMHKVKKNPNDPKDYGQKVMCAGEGCPVCATGDRPKSRWFLGVISRDTGTYKILDISWSVFDQLKNLAKNPKWGNPTRYDIEVYKDSNSQTPGGFYKVSGDPDSRGPLSAQDQVIKDENFDLDDLKRRVTPPTPENVQKRLDKIMGVENAVLPTATTTTVSKTSSNGAKKPTAKPAVSEGGDNGSGDMEFPSYDSQN